LSELLLREMDKTSEEVNVAINGMFAKACEPNALYDSSKHLIYAGGKRLRPFLTLKACEIVGGQRANS
jgi:geranylgeranyl diphosphate synthase type I